MEKTVFKAQHNPTTEIRVIVGREVADGSSGLDIWLCSPSGNFLQERYYNPNDVNVWFANNSKANLEPWRKAYHLAGQIVLKRPVPEIDYLELVTTPRRDTINKGLSPAKVATLKQIFGAFPDLGNDCGEIRNTRLRGLSHTNDVGPFNATGIQPALDDLKTIMAEVKRDHPKLHELLHSAGMMCYRCVRGVPGKPSNHASGTAIDLRIGTVLSPFNAVKVPRGLVILAEYFNAHGWFWAAGYNGRTDPMHMEVSNERLLAWDKAGLI